LLYVALAGAIASEVAANLSSLRADTQRELATLRTDLDSRHWTGGMLAPAGIIGFLNVRFLV
jgi:hypothetical protein